MKDLILQSNLPVINGNFDEVKTQLLEELKVYDLIVDADSVQEAKKMATQLNKVSENIDTLRKKTVGELSVPINAFVAQTKELTTLCQESRQKLLMQIKVYDDKARAECKRMLDIELVCAYKKYALYDEFQSVKVDDLATLTNLNKNGISKKASDAIDERVLERKNFQEKIDTRLLTLEGECFKAGLQAPLTRENISHFLMDSTDEVYNSKLQSLIANEITRIEVMNKRLKEIAGEEAAKANKQVESKPLQKIEIPDVKEEPKAIPKQYEHFKNLTEFAPVQKEEAKTSYTVTAIFEIEIDSKHENKIAGMLEKRFKDANFKTMPTIYVEQGVQNGSERIRA